MITHFDGQQVMRLKMLRTREHEIVRRSRSFGYLRWKGLVSATFRPCQSKAKA